MLMFSIVGDLERVTNGFSPRTLGNFFLAAQIVVDSSPGLSIHQCLWTCLQVCGLKRLGCYADHYTPSRCCTRGESEDHTGKQACFETQGRHHQKSKAQVSVTPWKGLTFYKKFLKKIKLWEFFPGKVKIIILHGMTLNQYEVRTHTKSDWNEHLKSWKLRKTQNSSSDGDDL